MIDNDEWGPMTSQGYFPARPENRFCAGVDLGKQVASTAIAIVRLERLPIEILPGDPNRGLDVNLRQKLGPKKIFVEHEERLPLKQSFVTQAAYLKALSLREPYRSAGCEWIVDRTGVGGAMVDVMSDTYNLHCIRVAITSGRNPGSDRDGSLTIPKGELMSALMAAFANRELQISPALPDYAEVMKQMKAMQVSFTTHNSMVFNGASGVHDDFCTAFALALYRLSPPRTGSRFSVQPISEII
jgi:hypothetical protein